MIKSWLLAFRIKTLSAAVAPVATSVALVRAERGYVDWLWVLCLGLSAVCIQIATNLFNDAIDFRKGADANRVGPTRVTQSGLLNERQVFFLAMVICLLAVLFGAPLVYRGGWPIVAIGLSSLFFAYAYTGGPFPLAYLGLGDVFVLLYFGFIAVTGSYYIFTLQGSWNAVLLGLQVGALATVLIAINNLRDRPTDAAVGKRTLAVRFGDRFVMAEVTALLLIAYALCFWWAYEFRDWGYLAYFLTAPLAWKVVSTVRGHQDKKSLLPSLGQAALLQTSFALIFCLASFL